MNNKKIKVKIVSENNDVVVKFFSLDSDINFDCFFMYYEENKDIISLNEGYKFTTSMYDFLFALDCDEVYEENFIIDENSLDYFYFFKSYDERYLSVLDDSFLEEWSDYDFPILFKYEINRKRNQYNSEKINFAISYVLIEFDFYSVYIDERITQNEINSILSFIDNENPIYIKLNSILDARNSTLKDFDNAYYFIKSYEEKIQKVIDNNVEEIEKKFKNELNKDLDNSLSCDCGFLLMYTNNKEYIKNKRLIINSPKKINNDTFLSVENLNIRFPIFTYSLNLKIKMFYFIQPILEKEFNDEFYFRTILD